MATRSTGFTVVVMQVNGDITDRRLYTWAELQGQEICRRLAQGFGLMLEEQLPPVIEDVARFRFPLPDGGYELDWQQADSVSALGTFFAAGRPRVTCLLLSGYDAVRDAAAVEASGNLLAGWREGTTMRAGPGLKSISDRPLLACIPWAGLQDAKESKRLNVWSLCLAEAFFRRAARVDDPSWN